MILRTYGSARGAKIRNYFPSTLFLGARTHILIEKEIKYLRMCVNYDKINV